MPPPGEQRQLTFVPPPGACRLLLVRHGESAAATEEQPFPLVDGHADPPLHEAGRHQADALAARLAGEPISAIYVTTLRRTGETAAPLAARLGLVPAVEPDLREVHLGEWEGGLYRRRVAEGHPLARRMLAEQRWDVIPGAEANAALDARVRGALTRMAARHIGQLVAAVCHGGVIASALAQATGARPFAFLGADNASVSRLVIAGDAWILRGFNDTSHLDAPLTAGAAPLG